MEVVYKKEVIDGHFLVLEGKNMSFKGYESVLTDQSLLEALEEVDVNNVLYADLTDCTKITDEGVKHLSLLVNVRNINLNGCINVTDHGVRTLSSLSDLEDLRFNRTMVDGSTLDSFPSLLHIRAEESKMGRDGLIWALRLPKIYSLNISNTQNLQVYHRYTEDDLNDAASNTTLNKLIADNSIYKKDIDWISLIPHLLNFQSSGEGLRDFDLFLEKAVDITSLKVLVLKNAGIKNIIGFDKLREIYTLSLPGNRLNNEFLQSLNDQLHLNNLDVDFNPTITDSSILLIGEIPDLHSLSISGCEITDEGLFNLRSITHLESVDFSNCPFVTDKGVISLASLPFVKAINLSGCPLVTSRGVKDLKALIPNVVVIS